jgi:hypothetical protein
MSFVLSCRASTCTWWSFANPAGSILKCSLERHKVGLCIHDILPEHPRHIFGGIAYVRFHGAAGK